MTLNEILVRPTAQAMSADETMSRAVAG
jgi:hypothetical protein